MSEYTPCIVPLADGWFQVEIQSASHVLMSARVCSREYGERICRAKLAKLREGGGRTDHNFTRIPNQRGAR